MFCPLCGAELTQDSSFCPQCGNPMNEDAAAAIASLAPGSPVRTTDMELSSDPTIQVPPQQEATSQNVGQTSWQDPYLGDAQQGAVQQTMRQPIPSPNQQAFQPQRPAGSSTQNPTRPKRSKLKALAIALLLLALGAAGFFAWKYFSTPKEDPSFILEIHTQGLEGLGTQGTPSPIPIRVKGTTESGQAISQVHPLEPDLAAGEEASGTLTLELPIGTYTVSAAGSPVSGSGTIYTIPSETYEVAAVISTSTTSDSNTNSSASGSETPPANSTSSNTSDTYYVAKVSSENGNPTAVSFSYTAILAEEISDAQIDEIEAWMQEAQLADASSFIQRIRSARDERLAQIEEEQAAEDARRKQAEADEKARQEAEKAAAEEEAGKRQAAMEEALASNPQELKLSEQDSGKRELSFTGVLDKFEIPEGAAMPELVGQTNYFLKLPKDVALPQDSDTADPLATNEIGVHIGQSAELDAHIGETVTISGLFVYMPRTDAPLLINIEGETITTY